MNLEAPAYLPNLFFLGNFDIIQNGASYPFSHFWSITIEEQFYVAWPFIIAFIPRRSLWVVFVGLIAASVYFRYAAMFNENVHYNLYYHTFSRMDTLVIGASFALLSIQFKWKISIRPLLGIVFAFYFILLFCFT